MAASNQNPVLEVSDLSTEKLIELITHCQQVLKARQEEEAVNALFPKFNSPQQNGATRVETVKAKSTSSKFTDVNSRPVKMQRVENKASVSNTADENEDITDHDNDFNQTTQSNTQSRQHYERNAQIDEDDNNHTAPIILRDAEKGPQLAWNLIN